MDEEVILVQDLDHEVLVGDVVHVHVPERDHDHHEDVEIEVEVVRTLDHVLVVEMVVMLVEEVTQDLGHLLSVPLLVVPLVAVPLVAVPLVAHDEITDIKSSHFDMFLKKIDLGN